MYKRLKKLLRFQPVRRSIYSFFKKHRTHKSRFAFRGERSEAAAGWAEKMSSTGGNGAGVLSLEK
jgi:hypothetical protein